jgi:hypothetical protein
MATQLSGYRSIALRRKGTHVAKWSTGAQVLRRVSDYGLTYQMGAAFSSLRAGVKAG